MIDINGYYLQNGKRSKFIELNLKAEESELETVLAKLRIENRCVKTKKGGKFVFSPDVFLVWGKQSFTSSEPNPKVSGSTSFKPTDRPIKSLLRIDVSHWNQ